LPAIELRSFPNFFQKTFNNFRKYLNMGIRPRFEGACQGSEPRVASAKFILEEGVRKFFEKWGSGECAGKK
jgi:hypothetical protein